LTGYERIRTCTPPLNLSFDRNRDSLHAGEHSVEGALLCTSRSIAALAGCGRSAGEHRACHEFSSLSRHAVRGSARRAAKRNAGVPLRCRADVQAAGSFPLTLPPTFIRLRLEFGGCWQHTRLRPRGAVAARGALARRRENWLAQTAGASRCENAAEPCCRH
jgi:hypothetical protein